MSTKEDREWQIHWNNVRERCDQDATKRRWTYMAKIMISYVIAVFFLFVCLCFSGSAKFPALLIAMFAATIILLLMYFGIWFGPMTK